MYLLHTAISRRVCFLLNTAISTSYLFLSTFLPFLFENDSRTNYSASDIVF